MHTRPIGIYGSHLTVYLRNDFGTKFRYEGAKLVNDRWYLRCKEAQVYCRHLEDQVWGRAFLYMNMRPFSGSQHIKSDVRYDASGGVYRRSYVLRICLQNHI